MRKRLASRRISAAIAAAFLAGCSTNGATSIPSSAQAPLTGFTLQVAVGTAIIGQDGNAPALNVVTTFRQSGGSTAVLMDDPALTGPAGFKVPAGARGAYSNPGAFPNIGGNVDAGTSTISTAPQVPLNVNPVNTTLGTFTGAFSYGFGPFNSDNVMTSVGAYMPGNPNQTPGNGFLSSIYAGSSVIALSQNTTFDATQPLPFYGTNLMDYLGGPPAYPFFKDGTFPGTFAGYSQGFYLFETPPVAGSYDLSVKIPAVNAAVQTYKASATLKSAASPFGGPLTVGGIIEDGKGGLSGTVTIPSGVTEAMVYIVDATAGLFYTVGPIKATGTQSWTLPDFLGPCNGTGCQNSASTQTASIAPGTVRAEYGRRLLCNGRRLRLSGVRSGAPGQYFDRTGHHRRERPGRFDYGRDNGAKQLLVLNGDCLA